MAYDYDVDILATLWTGGEDAQEPYASFIAANPELTDEVSENRILSTIELLRSHMELLQNREEAKLLHESISKLFRHSAGGSNPWSEVAAITTAVGNVPGPTFPAGASLDITIDGVTYSPTSATGGDCATVAAELNVTLDAVIPAAAEETTVGAVADVAGSLGSTYFTINSGGDVTAYYVWMSHPGLGESMSLDFTAITGGTLPVGAVPAAYFDITSTTATYRCWFSDGATIPPAVTTEILVPVSFTGADIDTVIAASATTAIVTGTGDADFAGFANGGTAVITGTLATVGNVTDPVDGAVATGAIIGTTTQGIAAATDPAPGGTGIAATYAVGDAAATVGAAVASAVGGNADFSASGTTTVTITAAATGVTTDAADVSTGFAISVTVQGSAGSGDAVPVQAFCEFPGPRLGIRAQEDFITFELANGSGGIIGPAGIIPGTYLSTPARVADQGRDLSLNHFAGTRRNTELTP